MAGLTEYQLRLAQKEPWQLTRKEWEILKGYESFVIFGEYSPSQYAQMSERTKQQIRRRHEEEARKNEAMWKEHENAVVHAYEEGKSVPPEVLRDYRHIVEARQQRRTLYSQEVQESIGRYAKAKFMNKSDFAEWYSTKMIKESPQLAGFKHSLRGQANQYWGITHEVPTKTTPKYAIEYVGIDEHRWKDACVVSKTADEKLCQGKNKNSAQK